MSQAKGLISFSLSETRSQADQDKTQREPNTGHLHKNKLVKIHFEIT